MADFKEKLDSAVYRAVTAGIRDRQTPVALTGVGSVQRAFFCHNLFCDLGRKIVYIAPDEISAREAHKNLSAFFDCAAYFPQKDITLFKADAHSREGEYGRVNALYEFVTGRANVLVTTAAAALQYTAADIDVITLKTGGTVGADELMAKLVDMGYTRSELVEGKGQFARRGGIIDIFSPSQETPVRIELWGDEIDCMGSFDVFTQRRIENVSEFCVLPAAELVPTVEERAQAVRALKRLSASYGAKGIDTRELDRAAHDIDNKTEASFDRYRGLVKGKDFTLFDHCGDALICVADEDKTGQSAAGYLGLLDEDIKSGIERGLLFGELCRFTLTKAQFYRELKKRDIVIFDNFLHSYKDLKPVSALSFAGKSLGTADDINVLCDDIFSYNESGFKVYVAVKDFRRADMMRQMLSDRGAKAAVTVLPVTGGMEITDMRLAVLCDRRADKKVKKRRIKSENGERIKSYNDLVPGDYVVHINHGIGKYLGIEKMTVQGITKDYIKLKYDGSDMIYIPTNQLDLISKYVSGDTGRRVKLSKMGGTDWARTKARVRRAVSDMADELIELYAERQSVKGYAFTPDTELQKDFEAGFEYTETEDQLKSASEIKADMERPVPMERLLCGDVGFGKTEVALRAVFKCVADGKQAAILVPTTILAWQHYQTATARFASLPINIETLSRYRTPKQQAAIIRRLQRGEIDIIIGTHRLIQKDVKFKDLGLIVVDEEQRFGVAHKERLKEMTKNVDSLTLTATPIPRTLSMALSGIRDMSLIEEPPRDRHPVSTYVLEYDFNILCEAMRQELRRGGQVFYLHNRVDSIDMTASRIAAALPGYRIRTAHGKMSEEQLSAVWDSLIEGSTDILVCTTIIETGVDIANANTLIVEDADRMGLSQLYQLRGRVGRSHRRAFCYLTYRRGRALSEEAEKRLSAIREFTDFGSGFKIAMRDLEIRGAGNILGAQQHGHLEAVGYDLYVKLLDEAVRLKKNEQSEESIECVFDVPLSAHIPFEYIESQAARIDVYKKIALISNKEDFDDMTDELCDRFGDIPNETLDLCRIALIRNTAARCGIKEIREENGRLIIDASGMDMKALSAAAEGFGPKLTFVPSPQAEVRIMPRQGLGILDEAETFVTKYSENREA